MNIRQIEVFRAIMLAGSVTDAARMLFVSQPGVSRMLGHLELQLGVKLFERIKGKLRPTPEAQTLFVQIEQVYRSVKRINDCAANLKTGAGLTLKVLATPSLALEIVPRAVAETAARFPEAMIYMEAQLAREIVAQLAAGEADIAVSALPIEHALLQSTPIGEWSLLCAFNRTNTLANARRVGPKDILKERLIAFSADTPQGQIISEWSEKAGMNPDARIEVRSGQIACALAAAGAGVAVVDTLTARAWRDPDLLFRPIVKAPTFEAYAVRNRSVATSRPIESFVERVRIILRQLQKPSAD